MILTEFWHLCYQLLLSRVWI